MPTLLFPTILPCFSPIFKQLRSKQLNSHWEECELVNYQYYMLWTEHIIFSGRNWQSTQASAKVSNTFTHLLRANFSPYDEVPLLLSRGICAEHINSPQRVNPPFSAVRRPETRPNSKPILLYVSYFCRSLIVTTTHFRATSPHSPTHLL